MRQKNERTKKNNFHILKSCILATCERCGENFTNNQLKKRMERKIKCVADGDMQISCWGCDEEFQDLYYLKIHQQHANDCPSYKYDSNESF